MTKLRGQRNVVYSSIKTYKEELMSLSCKGNFFADTHLHSNRSDGLFSPQEIIKIAIQNNFYVAITDHNTIVRSSDLSRRHKERLIPGIEILCRDGVEFLAYFYSLHDLTTCFNRYVKPNTYFIFRTSIEANWIISKLVKFNAIINIPHPLYPFDPFRKNFVRYLSEGKLSKESIASISNIEIFNAGHDFKINEKCLNIAYSLKKGICGGSDAHTKSALGSVLTYCDSSSKESFLDKFKNKNTSFIGTPTQKIKNTLPVLKMFYIHSKYFFRGKEN